MDSTRSTPSTLNPGDIPSTQIGRALLLQYRIVYLEVVTQNVDSGSEFTIGA